MDSPATILRHAFQYLIKFSGSTCIVHIDYTLLDNSYLHQLIADLIMMHRLGFSSVVVFSYPSVAAEADNPLDAQQFAAARRDIDDAARRIIRGYAHHGQDALTDDWVQSRPLDDRARAHHQYSGLIAGISNNRLGELVSTGTIPIIPPLGVDSAGNQHLLQSYHIVEALASAGAYSKAIFLQSAPIHRIAGMDDINRTGDGSDNGTDSFSLPIGAHADATEPWQISIRRLNEHGIGIFPLPVQPLMRTIDRILRGRVRRAHVIGSDASLRDCLFEELFLPRGAGLMVYSDEYEHIRALTRDDIEQLLVIRHPLVARGSLRALTEPEIMRDIDGYYLYEIDNVLVGAISRIERHAGYYEIGGLVVHNAFRNDGIAAKLLAHVSHHVDTHDETHFFALTSEAREWFTNHGFYTANIDTLPPQLQEYILKRHRQEKRSARYLMRAKRADIH